MKKTLLILVMLTNAKILSAQTPAIAIIPQPVSMIPGKGYFMLPQNIVIGTHSNSAEIKNIIQQLGSRLSTATGYTVTSGNNPTISLLINESPDKKIGNEGYQLNVTANGVTIQANKPAGIFYGVQTLLQLLPKEIESKERVNIPWIIVPGTKTNKGGFWNIPLVQINDYPRFGWRGLMLDVVRHYFTKQQVKDFIDHMVEYKYNMLHLHLTDDQGWRIEIKSLPKLTTVGGFRPERATWGQVTKPGEDEPKTYGGFYTQEDIKELIRYAQDRFVTILPEIDVPGHSLALVAAYPELSCTPGTYQVNAGERMSGRDSAGKSFRTVDNTLCPADEKVYEALDKIFTEVAQLFPFEYIHIGGDEAYKGYWEKSDAVKQLVKREKLKDMLEVQSYFVKRVEKIINSKGKKMMGWDEILEGGLAPNAAVMSWRGDKGGIEAAKMNHPVVMSPNTYAYVDLYQGDPIAEPPTYGMLRLSQSYKFNPVPTSVDPKYILGGQANLWSERLNTMRHAEYMLWPRAFAIAESVWSPLENKNWDNFVGRVESHFERFDVAGIKYARTLYDPIFSATKNSDNTISVKLQTEVTGLNIYYSFDETYPDNFYPAYTTPLKIPKDANNLIVITYRNGKPVGKMIKMPVTELQKRAK